MGPKRSDVERDFDEGHQCHKKARLDHHDRSPATDEPLSDAERDDMSPAPPAPDEPLTEDDESEAVLSDEEDDDADTDKKNDETIPLPPQDDALFQTVRAPGPNQLTAEQYMAASSVLDMVEHVCTVQVLEIIRMGDHVLKHAYDCCHDAATLSSGSVFKCADCGVVAETVAHQWNEDDDTLESKAPRYAKLIQTFLSKPIDPTF